MADHRTFVIVGAGLAGAKAAETLRAEGFDGRVVLLGDEPDRPYERPPLSKGLLLGTAERDSVFVHPESWYAEHDVDLRTGVRAEALDRAGHRLRLSTGDDLAYDRLLLATGAEPRTLPVPGADLDGVLRLRTLADSGRLAAAFAEGSRVVIAGAGWIGLEAAAAARQRGASVTVVEAGDLPLHRVLGDEMGAAFADLHREHGVDFRFRSRLREIRGAAGNSGTGRTPTPHAGPGTAARPGGRVSHAVLDDGTELPADAVLLAVGVRPRTGLAELAGLPVDNGILVDERLGTADPDVFAAGDVANVDHPLLRTRIRVEHWANALHTGPVAARAMLGRDVRYDRLPYFYTDQYDLGMEYAGWVAPGGSDGLVIRGDVGKREFIAFWTSGGRVLAGMNVNVWDVTDPIQDLIRAGLTGARADPARLADPAVPLESLTGG